MFFYPIVPTEPDCHVSENLLFRNLMIVIFPKSAETKLLLTH